MEFLYKAVAAIMAGIYWCVTMLRHVAARIRHVITQCRHQKPSSEKTQTRIDRHRFEKTPEDEMLHTLFHLEQVTVASVMIPLQDIERLDASMPVEELVEAVLESAYTRIPLYQDEANHIIGVLQARLLSKQFAKAKGDESALDFSAFVTEPTYVADTTTLFDQLKAFQRRRERFALVRDADGVLCGLITREDILEELIHTLVPDGA